MLTIFLVALILPAMGMVIGIFSPVPLIYLYLQKGRETGLVGIFFVVLALFISLGLRHAAFFLAEYGVLAALLSESILIRLSVNRAVLVGALGTGLASGILLFFAFFGEEGSISDFLREQVKTHLLQTLETLKNIGQGSEDLNVWDGKTIETLSEKLALSYPAFIFSGCLFASLVNYSMVGLLWKKLGRHSVYFTDRFSLWILPDFAIWFFIVSGATVWFLDKGIAYGFGLNVLILSITVYCFQGVAICVYFLESKAIPVFLWVILFVFVFTQPLLIGILIGLGVFDLWVDFRKLRTQTFHDTSDQGEE